MLFALLVYAYCLGIRSSRAIERLCTTDVAFRVLCAQDPPDHTTIARFRAEAGAAFAGLFTQVLLVAARAGLARFGTVAIDGTKIAADASIDANRGGDWLAQQVTAMVSEAEQVDAAEDAAEDAGDGRAVSDRVPGSPGSGRQERIRAAAEQVKRELARREAVGHAAAEGALERRRRSEAGEPVRGRIPNGPHHLAEAQAHLAREIGIHQAKLDRYAGLLAAGRTPMGRPPVPMEASARVVRARRVVEAARAAAAETPTPPERLPPSCRRWWRTRPTSSRGSWSVSSGLCKRPGWGLSSRGQAPGKVQLELVEGGGPVLAGGAAHEQLLVCASSS
jgi:hypothetical protein